MCLICSLRFKFCIIFRIVSRIKLTYFLDFCEVIYYLSSFSKITQEPTSNDTHAWVTMDIGFIFGTTDVHHSPNR